ncbi:MAG: hypothetical protein JW753_07405 [Dehalococcoidia bacterium]|nr:hypothetical protein [Dehalococcoidia bacterium]
MRKRKALTLLASLTAVLILVLTGFSGTALATNGTDDAPLDTSVVVDTGSGEVEKVIIDGKPPDVLAEAVEDPVPDIEAGINVIGDVPAYDWSYGCSATSAAMMFGFYDRNGYTNMYTGGTNYGIAPLTNAVWGHTTYPSVTCGECPLSATHQGVDGRAIKGHVDDYWVDYGDPGPDPYIGNWTEHTQGACTGDYMGTNQSDVGNSDGSTTFWYYTNGDPLYDYTGAEPGSRDGCHGMNLFAESRGYTVVTNFNQYILGQGSDPAKGFTFAQYCAEIDAGRPVLIHVTGHTMLGYGYNTTGNVVYLKDTWDYSSHTMTWGSTYSGLQHKGVSVMRLTPLLVTETIAYPGSFDTWSVASNPYWWHAGDSVTGTRTLSLPSVCEVGLYMRLSYNSLNGNGYVHQYLTINGQWIGSWDVYPGQTSVSKTFTTFSNVYGPTYTFAIIETNTVGSGLGSIAIAADKSTLRLLGGVTVTVKEDGGATASDIMVSDPWGYDTVGRWVHFSGGGTWTSAVVKVQTEASQLPQKQVYNTFSIPAGYPGSTALPIAITDWGSVTTYGQVRIIVTTSTGAKGILILPIVPYV